jgi:hypothetical protein
MGTIAAGAIIRAAGGFTSGALGTALNGGNLGQVLGSGLINAGIGAIGGAVGGAAAGWATKSVGNFAINGLKVAHRSAIGGFIAGSVGGAAGGGAAGFATGLLTGDIENAWKMAGQGALYGGIAGGVLGGVRGYKSAMPGTNKWTGNAKPIPETRNGHLAGGAHPKTGVPFDSDGFPNFKENLYKNGPNEVRIKPTGNRLGDFNAANNAAGYQSTPKGYTWHHHQTTGRMQLVESLTHMKTGHTGGFSIWKF